MTYREMWKSEEQVKRLYRKMRIMDILRYTFYVLALAVCGTWVYRVANDMPNGIWKYLSLACVCVAVIGTPIQL